MAQSLIISDKQLVEVEKTVEEKQQIVLKDIIVLWDEVNIDLKYLMEEITRVFATKEDLPKVKS